MAEEKHLEEKEFHFGDTVVFGECRKASPLCCLAADVAAEMRTRRTMVGDVLYMVRLIYEQVR